MKRLQITVPATIDGLGPGAGIAGLALTLVDTVQVEIDSEREEIDGPDLMIDAYRAWRAEGLPGARFTLEPGIPEGYGLGEGTARIVAGLAAAVAATETRDARQEVFRLALQHGACAARLAACVMGGLVTTLRQGDTMSAIHVADHLSMDVALFLLDERPALPPVPPHPARLAYLLTALLWGRWDWIGPAMRMDALPKPIDSVLAAARDAGAYGAAATGSTLIALAPLHAGEKVAATMNERARDVGLPGRSIVSAVRLPGVEIKTLEQPQSDSPQST